MLNPKPACVHGENQHTARPQAVWVGKSGMLRSTAWLQALWRPLLFTVGWTQTPIQTELSLFLDVFPLCDTKAHGYGGIESWLTSTRDVMEPCTAQSGTHISRV